MSRRRVFSMPPFLNVMSQETMLSNSTDISVYGFNKAIWVISPQYGVGKCFAKPTYASQFITSKEIKSYIESQNLSMNSTREIIIAGRSNVGKSSLINSLLESKVALTSKTPVFTIQGRTQALITFPLYFQAPGDVTLVDAPGYGFAKVADNLLSDWRTLTSTYFSQTSKLFRTVSLIDARHGVKENDKMLWEMLEEYKRFYVIVMTKADGISDAALKERFLEIADATRNNGYCSKIIFATSAK